MPDEKSFAVIVAGGRGNRMGCATEKQFLPLCGRPMLAHTLAPFQRCPSIVEIVLVVPEDRIRKAEQEIVLPFSLTKVRKVVPGGAVRQQSVHLGLRAIEGAGPRSVVVIHDGARPLIREGLIRTCVEEAKRFGAVILAVPSRDTLARVDPDSLTLVDFVDRQRVWRVQTPQCFTYELILEAHRIAEEQGYASTDDASLVRRLGHPVRVLEGSEENIKVTTPEDLYLAESLLERRAREG